MTNRLLAAATAATIWMGACGGESRPAFQDRVPPPEDPLVMDGDVGSYGGRFVSVGNGTPETFNPLMATTTPTNELGGQLFVRLTRLDGVTQEERPILASRWEQSADGLASCAGPEDSGPRSDR